MEGDFYLLASAGYFTGVDTGCPGAHDQGGFDKWLHANLLLLFKEQVSFCNPQKKGTVPYAVAFK